MLYPEEITYYKQKIQTKISLKPEFKYEREVMRILPADSIDQKYLSGEKQRAHEISFSESEGTFITKTGELLSGEYNFVVTCEDSPRIICHKTFNHSHLANGKKVLAAGELIFIENQLKNITNNSGHYRPEDNEMLGVIKALYVASKGMLTTYTSHCLAQPLSYPVVELLNVSDFSSVDSLFTNETIDRFTGNRKIREGYEIPERQNDRYQGFHRNLQKDLAMQYYKILNENVCFFSPANMDTSSEDLGINRTIQTNLRASISKSA